MAWQVGNHTYERLAFNYFDTLVAVFKQPRSQGKLNRSQRRHTIVHYVLTSAQEFQELWPELNLVLDGGKIEEAPGEGRESRTGSTVIDLSQQGKFKIIRQGK